MNPAPTLRLAAASAFFAGLVVACAPPPRAAAGSDAPPRAPVSVPLPAGPEAPPRCESGPPLTVRFYDAGQALAALVELPDGRRVLVDSGEDPRRAACGPACTLWHERVMAGLRRDVGARGLDLLWITHQHSDHLGGAPAILASFRVASYVDNGRDLDTRGVTSARQAANDHGVRVQVVTEGERAAPLAPSASVTLTPVVPARYPRSCERNPNDCSIGLRIDYCESSILFTGDAEEEEEALLDPRGPVTLLQVGHHGSASSSSPAFLGRTQPRYAVVACAPRGEGTNRRYCHPRRQTVERLNRTLGGAPSGRAWAFDGSVPCGREGDAGWDEVATSERLWITARDGEVALVTSGDGIFERSRP
jgi:competence protein ComEC